MHIEYDLARCKKIFETAEMNTSIYFIMGETVLSSRCIAGLHGAGREATMLSRLSSRISAE